MTVLNSEMVSLLDKLYNLRGQDSDILVSMEKERQTALKTCDETSSLKAKLQSQINELDSKQNSLQAEGDKLTKTLAAINADDFRVVIDELSLDFNPEALKLKIEQLLPETLSQVSQEYHDASEKLVHVDDELNEAISKIEELGIRHDEAIANQEQLNKYINLALETNVNVTRDEITSLLAKFNFNETERIEVAKILMFPEDGLFEYDKIYTDRPVNDKSISEVIKEAKGDESMDTDEEGNESNSAIILQPVINEPIEEHADEKIEPIKANIISDYNVENTSSKEYTQQDLVDFLKKLNFDYLDFTSGDMQKLLDNFDEELYKNNINFIDDNGINRDIFNDNVELLYDKDLINKINLLKEIGKLSKDIYLNPTILIKYNLLELNSAIKLLQESGLNPKDVPLMAY